MIPYINVINIAIHILMPVSGLWDSMSVEHLCYFFLNCGINLIVEWFNNDAIVKLCYVEIKPSSSGYFLHMGTRRKNHMIRRKVSVPLLSSVPVLPPI